MVSWVMLTLSSREHIPPLSSFTNSVPCRCSKYSHPSFRQKNEPENVRAHKLSRIKGVLSPSHLADRPSSDSNLSQTSPISIKKALASVEWLDALDTLMPPALTH